MTKNTGGPVFPLPLCNDCDLAQWEIFRNLWGNV